VAKKGYYALYQGDVLLENGTIDGISEKLGIKKQSLHYLGTPAYAKRDNALTNKYTNRKILIRVEDEDD